MSIQRKMYEANKALSYFVTHDWEFKNDNFVDLCRYLKLEDVKDWEYRDMFTFDLLLAVSVVEGAKWLKIPQLFTFSYETL